MPGSPFTLGITVYDTNGTTALANAKVTVRNENTNDSISKNTDSSGQIVVNFANFADGWTVGDIISYFVLYTGFEASGSLTASDTGGTTVTLTLAAVPTTPSLKLFTVQEFLDSYSLATYDADPENGLKPAIVVRVGQTVERHIEQLTNRKWDNNNGSYYTATNEYHNADGPPPVWPESIGSANLSSTTVFYAKNTPIKTLTTFQANSVAPNATAVWNTLTEDDNEIRLKESLGRVEIVDSSKYPAAGKDQVRMTYTYGEDSVPDDIKRLAILMTAKAFSGQMLQRLNIDSTEATGLGTVMMIYRGIDDEIKLILENRRFSDIRGI